MEIQKKYHISIGSNIGNRIKNIQETIDLIHSRIASLLSISSIYETESIGFEGDDFFNICASFNSFKSRAKKTASYESFHIRGFI